MICDNVEIKGSDLYFGGRKVADLAKKYGTPLYVMDEATVRRNCRKYVSAMKKYFGETAMPLYAGKACCFRKLYGIISSENMGADVVSAGEIYTASSAGFDPELLYFHSNSKTDFDIEFAIKNGVGYFVVDNIEEIMSIDRIARENGMLQKILLRITPGIDTHTYEAIRTGNVDSKFGFPIETGAAFEAVEKSLSCENIKLCGFHCHVGSQLFESDVFIRSADIMLEFISEIEIRTGYCAGILDLGGGYGVRYTENDPVIDIEDNIRLVAEHYFEKCSQLGLEPPCVRLEPGRSIVADAGLTLYTVGTVKRIPGYKNYVSVDGGMGDNPRHALYGAKYTAIAADKADEPCDMGCSLVGKYCESGDIITTDAALPSSIKRGDLIAVLTTGAYNYSMSMNYNRIPKPAVVMINGEDDYIAVKRETLEDIVRNDM